MHGLHKGASNHAARFPLRAIETTTNNSQSYGVLRETRFTLRFWDNALSIYSSSGERAMVLSNDNVAKTSGNGSSSVIRKIHNMPWLKQANDPKNSDQGRATGGAMFNALANLKEDGETTSEKKSKRKNRKSKNSKQKSDVPKNMEILIKCNDTATRSNARVADDLVTKDSQLSVAGGQPGGGKGVWGVDKNIVGELFPGAAEAARNQELEDEQLTMAVAASLESAFLEKCAIDPPEEDNVEAAKLSDDENIWDGVHKNLPSPSGEETVGDFDANNNSGSNKSRSSSVATRKSDGKDSSCEGSKAAATETPSGAGKIDEQLTPAVRPKFIDKFGRVDGYTEKRLFMGKGARGKEDEYRRRLQQEHGNSANGPNQRPRNNFGSRDTRPRNGRQSVGNPGNDNRGSGNGPNDSYAHPVPRDPRRYRHGRSFGDYPRNDVGGPSTQSVIANLQQQHRGSQPTQGPNRLRNHQAEEDSRNDRQQGRFSRRENPDVRHNYREPYDPTRKNPYKYTRGPDEPDKRISDKSDGERDANENRTENANREGDEKKIQPLMSAPVEPPSFAAVQESARESSTPIDQTRPLVETPGEPQIKIEPGVSPKKTAEFAGDPVKPQVHLKDFNSRYNTAQEPTALQARPNPAGSNSFHSAATIGHTCIADSSGQTSAIQFPPARFSVPPPGFGRLENTQVSSSNAAYVLPVDSSPGCSAYVVPAESSRTSSAYCLPADSASDSFSEIDEMEAVYSRIKMYDPMLYDLLMKRDQRRAARRSAQMNAIAYPTIPENCNVLPVDPRSFQATPASYDAPSERPSETLNPNAKQYSPITKQAWITHDQQDPMSCYSVPPNYDPQSAGVYCQYAGQPQDMIRQDNSGWIAATPQQLYAPVHPGQRHGHYANEPNAPTAILGRQGLLVSEHNLPYKNAQRPMNLQPLNDDYTIRCQPSGFGDISTDPQRQVQYRASHHQFGVAPSQFCSMPCEGSHGNQTAMSKFMNYVQQAPHPLHQYAQFVAKNRNSMNSMNQGNGCFFNDNDEQIRGFAQPGCGAREPTSINQTERTFVQPIIPPMSFSEKPGKGRGRGRRDNKQ